MSTPHPSRPVRIVIVTAQAIFRDALRLLLDAEPEFRVVGTAAACMDAVRLALDGRADIVLLDVGTDRLPDLHAFLVLTNACVSARVLLLVPDVDDAKVVEMLRSGARGVVVKGVSTEVLFESIRAVAAGQYWAGREMMPRLVQIFLAGNEAASPHPFCLTARELHIVTVLVDGRSNKQIAELCGISEKTVKFHLTNIFEKTGVSNRLELTIFALHHRLVLPQTFV